MSGFESLTVWQSARSFVVEVYRASDQGTFKRDWGLKDQIRRAVISIASNIAEGHQRKYRKDFARFLTIALGSAGEARTQLYLAQDLGHLPAPEAERLLQLARSLSASLDRLRTIVAQQSDADHP
jgi:four helix bundle protein